MELQPLQHCLNLPTIVGVIALERIDYVVALPVFYGSIEHSILDTVAAASSLRYLRPWPLWIRPANFSNWHHIWFYFNFNLFQFLDLIQCPPRQM